MFSRSMLITEYARKAASTLGKIDGDARSVVLIESLRDPSEVIRRGATWGFGEIRSTEREVSDALNETLHGPCDQYVRGPSAEALRKSQYQKLTQRTAGSGARTSLKSHLPGKGKSQRSGGPCDRSTCPP